MVRPCVIVINWAEMYTSESLTQMYLFLVFMFGRTQDIETCVISVMTEPVHWSHF